MRHAVGSVIVSLFAMVFMHGAWVLRLVNPVFSRYLGAGLPGGPNVLLTVRGRSSSREYRVPVAMLAFHDRRFVQAAFGEAGPVRNLRAAGQSRIVRGRSPALVDAVELASEAAAAIMREALKLFRRSRLLAAVIGPTTRPPVRVLQYFGVRIDDTLDQYVAGARRQPLFELLPHK
ncbi:MAG: nitroreductase/quinone reductase family protein [Chloroflexi bacterium]|nr:nitroreductase/quinone reductase family protein [Chloroflexota bacterium]